MLVVVIVTMNSTKRVLRSHILIMDICQRPLQSSCLTTACNCLFCLCLAGSNNDCARQVQDARSGHAANDLVLNHAYKRSAAAGLSKVDMCITQPTATLVQRQLAGQHPRAKHCAAATQKWPHQSSAPMPQKTPAAPVVLSCPSPEACQ